MSNLANFEFVIINITRKNYLYWILNVEIHLDGMGLGISLKKEIKHLSNQHAFIWLNKTMNF